MYPQRVFGLFLFFPLVLSRFVPIAFSKSEIPSLSEDTIPCNKPSNNVIQLDKNDYHSDSKKESIDTETSIVPPLSTSLWLQETEASVNLGQKSDIQEFENTEAQETVNLSDTANTHTLQSEGDDPKISAQNEAVSKIHQQSNEISPEIQTGLTKRAGFGLARLASSFGRGLGRTRRISGSSRGLRKAPSFGRGASRLGKTRTPKPKVPKFKKTKTSTSGGKIRNKFSRKKSANKNENVSPAISRDKNIDSQLDTKTPAVGKKGTTGSTISGGLPAAGDLSNISGGKGTGSAPAPASGVAGDNVPVTKKKGAVDDSDDEFDQNEVREKNQGGGKSGRGSAVAANLAGTVPFLAMPLAGGLMGGGGDGGNGGGGSGSRDTASADDEEEAPEGAEAQSESATSAKSSQKSSAKAES